MNYFSHYESPLGNITLVSNGYCLTGLYFEGQKYFPNILPKTYKEKDVPILKETKKWLNIHFSGKKPNFTPKIFFCSTPFREAVWKELLKIPYGQTTTYSKIASQIANLYNLKAMSSQAVGGAVGRNPISIIIPCHRVVGASGSLVGYAAGIDKKEYLLRLEKN